jgi:elongation factor Ts
MSNLTILIKELREKTGAGFLDCKKSLEENNNDIEKSVESLRKKGLAKASKKSDRDANEGAIGIYSNESFSVLIKVNSETDFAAKSDTFLNFLDNLGKIILDNNDDNLDKSQFLKLDYENGTVQDYFNAMIAKIGENLILNDLIIKNNKNSSYSFYIHNSYRNNIGKIISFLEYSADDTNNDIKTLSKNLCMHIAAMKPESLDIDDLDKKFVANEEKIQRELILNSGKPSNIAEKILDGKMKKFYSEVTLLNQSYILDQDKNVRSIINEYSKFNFKLISFELIIL